MNKNVEKKTYDSVKVRLKMLLTENRIKESDFCRLLKVSQGYISGMRTSIQPDKLKSIAINFPTWNIGWLLTGEGEMLKGEVKNNHIEEKVSYCLVPLKNLDAVGGFGSNDAIDINEYTVGFMPFTDAREGDICIPVTGDSMTPTCPAGSIVLLREVERWGEYLGYGNIFVLFLMDGRRILKEVARYDVNPNEYVLCVSHNESVAPEPLPKGLIRGVWKVIKILTDKGY